MNHFINALETSIKTENWYSVLFISLSLPDICGKIDNPTAGSKKRSIEWFDKYMKNLYIYKIGPMGKEVSFLSGSDFYALRCAYLHEGSDDITNQNAQETLEKFEFIEPNSNMVKMHMNLRGKTLQLQVSEFGKEILTALKQWTIDVKEDHIKQDKITKLLNIHILDCSNGISF
ncbi:hypothetical protein [Acinetobacter baumannii]|uniref:hypothetical protein n=1 Tax=Acinetobacter baumannii TaxID=470 RepID=UPI00028E686A|nr:hypothetical protein [Acinetobacter baumannii]EHU2349629.1 hypothetical protein [Acinetobacter baumannii]EHU2369946.1 hypothetical protein [Acinetobacter baumannii]EHU2572177.1 hypothetical protein [Acinetobacter baumannii]EKL41000.1 hypothetical protein ACIN5098_2653 [Acinetobacter baumannii OIFC098]KRR95696.1 hypothetical protein ASM30_01400 [Acinetobacter baumannii]